MKKIMLSLIEMILIIDLDLGLMLGLLNIFPIFTELFRNAVGG